VKLAALILLLAARQDAAEWNRIGIEKLDAGEVSGAIEAFGKARALAPENEVVRRNLAVAIFRRGDEAFRAEAFARAASDFAEASALVPDHAPYLLHRALALEKGGREEDALALLLDATERFPKEPDAFELLGETMRKKGRISEAAAALEKALALDPKRERARRRLEALRRDLAVEGEFVLEGSVHFDFRYDGARSDLTRGAGVLAEILDAAWEKVAAELATYPTERLPVVLYDGKQFREATETGEWVGGLYDGRIRIPVESLFGERERLARVAAHEISHAFLHRGGASVPPWADEGFAQRMEGRDAAAASKAVRASRLPPITAEELRRPFLEMSDRRRIALAYSSSLSFVDWLFRRAGREAFLAYLRESAKGEEAAAFSAAFGVPFEEALAAWRLEIGEGR
jgi:tetratricopeptide (TPR) repeat protein